MPRLGLVVVAAIGLATCVGCGGGGGLSSDQLVRKADAICAGANMRVRLLGPEPPILTAEQASWIERLTRIDRHAVAKLRELEPESAQRRALGEMLSDFERGLRHGEAIARASRAPGRTTTRRSAPRSKRRSARSRWPRPGQRSSVCRSALLGRVVR